MNKALFVGLTTVDIQFFTDFYPKENSKTKATNHAFFAGGPATNAAIIFSKLQARSFKM